MNGNVVDLIGKQFYRLTVIEFSFCRKGNSFWLCQCICGNTSIVMARALKTGHTKSCGCLQRETSKKVNTHHGMEHTNFYTVWCNIKARCLNKNGKDYPYYGARGIKVCDRWLNSFENFMEDMYSSYKQGLELDRIDVNGNYEPSNCRWITHKANGQNTRVSSNTSNFKLQKKWRNILTCAISQVLSARQKTSWVFDAYVGCSEVEFKRYLESQFAEGMTWDNYGKYLLGSKKTWNLDHIISVNNFDLSTIENRKNCYNYKNLRPLWAKDNAFKDRIRHDKN